MKAIQKYTGVYVGLAATPKTTTEWIITEKKMNKIVGKSSKRLVGVACLNVVLPSSDKFLQRS